MPWGACTAKPRFPRGSLPSLHPLQPDDVAPRCSNTPPYPRQKRPTIPHTHSVRSVSSTAAAEPPIPSCGSVELLWVAATKLATPLVPRPRVVITPKHWDRRGAGWQVITPTIRRSGGARTRRAPVVAFTPALKIAFTLALTPHAAGGGASGAGKRTHAHGTCGLELGLDLT